MGLFINKINIIKKEKEGEKMSKKFIVAVMVLVLMVVLLATACGSEVADTATDVASATRQPDAATSDEVYVWACQYNSLPLFVNNDYIGMDLIAEQLGVTVKKIGPQEVDLAAMVAAIEQEIAQKPDGMMVVGWDASLATVIDKVADAGIPVITVDADVFGTKRLCFVGSDWYEFGVEQAKGLAEKIGADATGKAVMMGLPGHDLMLLSSKGYVETLGDLCPGVTVDLQIYDSQSNTQKCAETVANLLRSDDSIIAVAGLDGTTGPGIAQAIEESGKKGKVWGTCTDAELEHLQGVKDGYLACAVGQKRHFFTYYGVRMLYDYNHNGIHFTKDDASIGISPIPAEISTGFIVATDKNVDLLIESANEKAK